MPTIGDDIIGISYEVVKRELEIPLVNKYHNSHYNDVSFTMVINNDSASVPVGGSVEVVDTVTGVVKYTPTIGFTGNDSFKYYLAYSDNGNNTTTNEVTVNLNVRAMRNFNSEGDYNAFLSPLNSGISLTGVPPTIFVTTHDTLDSQSTLSVNDRLLFKYINFIGDVTFNISISDGNSSSYSYTSGSYFVQDFIENVKQLLSPLGIVTTFDGISIIVTNIGDKTITIDYNTTNTLDDPIFRASTNITSTNNVITFFDLNEAPIVPSLTNVDMIEDTIASFVLPFTDPTPTIFGISFEITDTPPSSNIDSYSLADNVLTVTPADNYFGSLEFKYRVFDGEFYSSNSTFNIIVAGIDDPAVVPSITRRYNILEDNLHWFDLSATDSIDRVYNDYELIYNITSYPSNGTLYTSNTIPILVDDSLSVNGAHYNVLYTVDGDASAFKLFKQLQGISEKLTVNSIRALGGFAQQIGENNSSFVFAFNGTNPNISNLYIQLGNDEKLDVAFTQDINALIPAQSNPLPHPFMLYQPNANYSGTDELKYNTSDRIQAGLQDSTIKINITSVDDPPVIENVTLVINNGVSPVLSDSIQAFSIVQRSDDINDTSSVVKIQFNAGDIDSNYAVFVEDIPNTISFYDNDNKTNTLVVSNGILELDTLLVSGEKLYTLFLDTNASDSDIYFNIVVRDGLSSSDTELISKQIPFLVTTRPEFNNPVVVANYGADATSFSITIDEDTSFVIIPKSPGNNNAVFSVTNHNGQFGANTTNGVARDNLTDSLYNPSTASDDFVYHTFPNKHGSDSFEITKIVNGVSSDTAIFNITVTSVIDLPISNDVQVNTNEDTTINITLIGRIYDVDRTTMSFGVSNESFTDDSAILTFGSTNVRTSGIYPGTQVGGTQLDDKGLYKEFHIELLYTPSQDVNGTFSFQYSASVEDDDNGKIVGHFSTATINVAAVTDIINIQDMSFVIQEDLSFVLGTSLIDYRIDSQYSEIFAASTPDNSVLEYFARSFPSNGTLLDSNGIEISNIYETTLQLDTGTNKFTGDIVVDGAINLIFGYTYIINISNGPLFVDVDGVYKTDYDPTHFTVDASFIAENIINMAQDVTQTLTPINIINSGISLNGYTFSYVPNPDYYGNDGFEYIQSSTDPNGSTTLSESKQISFTITPINDGPFMKIPPHTLQVNEDELFDSSFAIGDVDSNISDISLLLGDSSIPNWLTISEITTIDTANEIVIYEMSGTPLQVDSGLNHNVNLRFTDGIITSDVSFSINVLSVQDPPKFILGGDTDIYGISDNAVVSIAEKLDFVYDISFVDDDGDQVTVDVSFLDARTRYVDEFGLYYDSNLKGIRGKIPAYDAVDLNNNLHRLRITLSDNNLNSPDTVLSFTINVVDIDEAPVIDETTIPTGATVGLDYTANLSAVDADGDDIVFSLISHPRWMTMNLSDGLYTLTGRPNTSDQNNNTTQSQRRVVIQATSVNSSVFSNYEFIISVIPQSISDVSVTSIYYIIRVL